MDWADTNRVIRCVHMFYKVACSAQPASPCRQVISSTFGADTCLCMCFSFVLDWLSLLLLFLAGLQFEIETLAQAKGHLWLMKPVQLLSSLDLVFRCTQLYSWFAASWQCLNHSTLCREIIPANIQCMIYYMLLIACSSTSQYCCKQMLAFKAAQTLKKKWSNKKFYLLFQHFGGWGTK